MLSLFGLAPLLTSTLLTFQNKLADVLALAPPRAGTRMHESCPTNTLQHIRSQVTAMSVESNRPMHFGQCCRQKELLPARVRDE